MSAWEIVASWAEDRAKLWRHDATKAANAYLTNPMAEACNAYAIALGKCAAIMDREAKVFLARARQAPCVAEVGHDEHCRVCGVHQIHRTRSR